MVLSFDSNSHHRAKAEVVLDQIFTSDPFIHFKGSAKEAL